MSAPQIFKNIKEIEQMIESGSNSNGNYIKYSDGTMICYHQIQKNISNISISDGIYYAQQVFTYPQPFIEIPNVSHFCAQTTGIYWSGLGNNGVSDSKVAVRILKMSEFTNVNITVGYIAIGRWK